MKLETGPFTNNLPNVAKIAEFDNGREESIIALLENADLPYCLSNI